MRFALRAYGPQGSSRRLLASGPDGGAPCDSIVIAELQDAIDKAHDPSGVIGVFPDHAGVVDAANLLVGLALSTEMLGSAPTPPTTRCPVWITPASRRPVAMWLLVMLLASMSAPTTPGAPTKSAV